MKIIEPNEVPDRVLSKVKNKWQNKWHEAVEAVRAGKVAVITQDEYAEYASLHTLRASLKVTFDRVGIKISTRVDPETRDLYIMRNQSAD